MVGCDLLPLRYERRKRVGLLWGGVGWKLQKEGRRQRDGRKAHTYIHWHGGEDGETSIWSLALGLGGSHVWYWNFSFSLSQKVDYRKRGGWQEKWLRFAGLF